MTYEQSIELAKKSNADMLNPKTIPGPGPGNAFFEASAKTLANLASRWKDESKYENIADYASPLRKIAESLGVEIVEMTRRPFGVKYRTDGKLYHAFIKGNRFEYKRIA